MQNDKDAAVPRADVHDEEKIWVPALDKNPLGSALVDDAAKPRASTFSLFERITYLLTRYGIETTGYEQ